MYVEMWLKWPNTFWATVYILKRDCLLERLLLGCRPCKSFLQQNTEIALSILSYTPADWVLVRWSQGSESSQIHMPTRSALKCQLGMWRHKTRVVRVTFQQAAGRLKSIEFTVAIVFLLNNIEESISQHAALTSGAVLFNWVFSVYSDLSSSCNSVVIYTSQTANNQAWL